MEKTIPRKIADIALKSMLYEVSTRPKPGLVDSIDNGAHMDMDIFTFIDSSVSLYSFMHQCSELGYSGNYEDPRELFKSLRELGLEAEKNMFYATNGINTQKGLIFILGIVCASAGNLLSKGIGINIEDICRLSANMVGDIVDKELLYIDETHKLTQGQKIFLKYGIKGIRGEVETGFPTIRNYGLPNLHKYLDKGLSLNNALANTLLHIMAHSEDTNVLWRGGMDAFLFMQNSAKVAIEMGGIGTEEGRKNIDNMNSEFIKNNISPGGSADLLATTIMFYLLDKEFNKNGKEKLEK